jgi:hypothetical protein
MRGRGARGSHQGEGGQHQQQEGKQKGHEKKGMVAVVSTVELGQGAAGGAGEAAGGAEAAAGGGSGWCGSVSQRRQYVEAVQRSTFEMFGSSCNTWWPELTDDVLLLLADVVVDSATAATTPAALRYRKMGRRNRRTRQQLKQQQEQGKEEVIAGAVSVPGSAEADADDADAAVRGSVGGVSNDGGSGVVLGSLTVRRLFDKEADNHHIEVLLSAQLAARELRHMLQQLKQQQGGDRYYQQQQQLEPHGDHHHHHHQQQQGEEDQQQQPHGAGDHQQQQQGEEDQHHQQQQQQGQGGIPLCLAPWLHQVKGRLVDIVGRLKDPPAHSGWIGGVTNHPEVFVPLYRCLLGVWVTAAAGGSDAVTPIAAAAAGAALTLAKPPALVTEQQEQGGRVTATAAAASDGTSTEGVAAADQAVAVAVRQLKELQPALLLWPMLQELEDLLGDGRGGREDGGGKDAGVGDPGRKLGGSRERGTSSGEGVLFLLKECCWYAEDQ